MPRGELSSEERAAGEIIAEQLGGGHVIPRDVPGAPDRTHELDVETNGRRIAVEVTAARDSNILSMHAAASRNWAAPSLGHDWWIGAPGEPALDVKRLMTGLEPHLRALERHKVTQVSGPLGAPPAASGELGDAIAAIFDLHASRVTLMREVPEGDAALVLSTHNGTVADPETVNELVAERAAVKAPKLLDAQADERHLFVWVDSSHADAELAMFAQPPPATVPEIPKGIDAVWAATGGLGGTFERLWLLRPPGRWESIRRR